MISCIIVRLLINIYALVLISNKHIDKIHEILLKQKLKFELLGIIIEINSEYQRNLSSSVMTRTSHTTIGYK